jgi:HCOMODA/2-hydroxy-3-carboxy-muconic semialdehyde decarboxylase
MQLQAQQLGEPEFLTAEEAVSTMETNEKQVERPWALWKAAAQSRRSA